MKLSDAKPSTEISSLKSPDDGESYRERFVRAASEIKTDAAEILIMDGTNRPGIENRLAKMCEVAQSLYQNQENKPFNTIQECTGNILKTVEDYGAQAQTEGPRNIPLGAKNQIIAFIDISQVSTNKDFERWAKREFGAELTTGQLQRLCDYFAKHEIVHSDSSNFVLNDNAADKEVLTFDGKTLPVQAKDRIELAREMHADLSVFLIDYQKASSSNDPAKVEQVKSDAQLLIDIRESRYTLDPKHNTATLLKTAQLLTPEEISGVSDRDLLQLANRTVSRFIENGQPQYHYMKEELARLKDSSN